MSNLHHEQILTDARADVEQLLERGEFLKVRAIINGLRDSGFRSESDALEALYEAAQEPEDHRDWADRTGTYPN